MSKVAGPVNWEDFWEILNFMTKDACNKHHRFLTSPRGQFITVPSSKGLKSVRGHLCGSLDQIKVRSEIIDTLKSD
ncbi:hypothetical protein BLNAU_13978 [Blattamonas nauphoetae]|uniref:HicA-like toxin of HicAB toxin-antitoxin system n=1 Tax=Blattamonas nauphoetae TaxID=2049346 RepID=A0ABQ9XIU8_9EUKA|nr:hypothetical protein BLNAU_13978 [Blattamonas nauphoetae]